MTALETPAPDAPAAEWGLLAERIPDWRWPDGMHDAAPGFVRSRYGIGSTGDVIPYAAEVAGAPVVVCYPDPDHWAWEGWLLALLGPYVNVIVREHTTVVRILPDDPPPDEPQGESTRGIGVTLGRACIAAAAALGRWPGGAS